MMELGIDDESEISTTHDKSKDSAKSAPEEQPTGDEQEDTDTEDTSGKSNDAKLKAIGLKKRSIHKFHDTLNHLSILLSEKFDNVSRDGTEFIVNINDRRFTIKFDDKFFMVSEDYNFELGDDSDIQSILNTLLNYHHYHMKTWCKEYNQELL